MSKGLRTVLRLLLAWVLLLVLSAACALGAAAWLWKGDMLSAAQRAELRGMQRQRVTAELEAQAAQYGFSAESAGELLTDELLKQSSENARQWLSSLLTDNPLPPPVFSLDGLEELLLADEGFRASVDSYERRTVARDIVSAAVDAKLSAAVLPLRAEAISALRQRVHLPAFLSGLNADAFRRLEVLALLLSLALAMLLYPGHRAAGGFRRMGRALIAFGLLWLAIALGLWALRIPAQATAVSDIAGFWAKALQRGLLLRLAVWIGVALLVGLFLTVLPRFRKKGGA